MNINNFAEWQRRQGHPVICTQSSQWYYAGMRVLQAFPYANLIQPSENELRHLMLAHGVLALRYSAPLDSEKGMISYHVVQKNPYNLEVIGKKARHCVRQGLSHCQVEPISFDRLAEEGWELQRDTLERQGRIKSMNKQDWQKICQSARDLPGFEAWGTLIHGDLAASLLTSRIDDTCYTLYSLSRTKFLELCVNNAIFYSITCNMLAREGVNQVFYTVQSLDAPATVDEFKFRMGFNVKPVRQRVVFHPLLAPFVNPSTFRLIMGLLTRYPGNYVLAKAEGMMRFYLNGKKPIAQQVWPDCLSESMLRSPEFQVKGMVTRFSNLNEDTISNKS